jgi:hypothetical protein
MRVWPTLSVVALTLPMLACVERTLAGDDGETQSELETGSTETGTSTSESEGTTSAPWR